MRKLILLPLVLILFAVPMADDILVEDFEQFGVPSGWQVWEENSPNEYSWSFWKHEGMGYGGSDYYAARFYDANDVDSWLVTPTLDMSGYESLSLSCWHVGYDEANYTGTFVMGTDTASPSASDFVQLSELGEPPHIWDWTECMIDASALDGKSSVTLAIRYTGANGHGLLLDDVLVTGNLTAIETTSLGEIKAIYK